MLRSYEFYFDNLGLSKEEVDNYLRIFDNVSNNVINEEDIRSINEEALKLCIIEEKDDVFRKLVQPFKVIKNGEVSYKYLIDAFSTEILSFINSLPSSIMEKYSKEIASGNNVTLDEVSKGIVLCSRDRKKFLIDSLFSIPKDLVDQIKIGDVLARQISGWCHPIMSERDVIYYSEISNLYPSLELYSKNILTTYNDTAGCYDDYTSECQTEIRIDYNSLSDENKKYADALVRRGVAVRIAEHNGEGISIFTECNPHETVGSVNERTFEIISGFKRQNVLYGIYTTDDLIAQLNCHANWLSDSDWNNICDLFNGCENVVDAIIGAAKYDPYLIFFYDEERKIFFKDKVYYDKYNEFTGYVPGTGLGL